MKQFKDLVFKKHQNQNIGFETQAVLNFDNGYGVSVITGRSAYCSEGTFEVAVLHGGEICCITDITDDVLSHQTPDMIDEVMAKIQSL